MAAPADAPLRLPHLPADIIVEILSRLDDPVAVVRCAATCKAWRRLILEPYFVSRRRAGSSSLLGYFFRDTSQKRPRRRRFLGRPTRFLLLGPPLSVFHLSHFLPNAAGLSGFDPVVSGAGGLLALRRAQGNSLDPIRICVCDPMAGTSTFLAPLPHIPFLENVHHGRRFRATESLEFLDADDGSSFRLLAARKHAWGILLRVFSSQTGQWGTAVTAQRPDDMTVVYLCFPAVVHHGAIHWICESLARPYTVHALAVRLGQTEASVRRVDLPLQAGMSRRRAEAVRLSSSAQGCLSLVFVDKPVINIWNFQDDGTGGKSSWALHKKTVYLPSEVLALNIFEYIHPEGRIHIAALCGQTSLLYLRIECEGIFVVNLETGMTSKVCDDWDKSDGCGKNDCPYVLDLSSSLRAMKSF